MRIALTILAVLASAQTFAQQPIPVPKPEEVTKEILRDAKVPPANSAAEMRKKALEQALEKQFTPEELQEYRRKMRARERAKSGGYSEDVKLRKPRSLEVSTASTKEPEEILASAGTSTTLVFTDGAGHPWKVEDARVPGTLVQATRRGHFVILDPAEGGEPYGRGNISVFLEGLPSVVVFGLTMGNSPEVDSIVNVAVAGRNPGAPAAASRPPGAGESDPEFVNFLDGTPPEGARVLKTSHTETLAWAYKGAFYIRTPLVLHSPAPDLSAGSARGVSMYRFASNPVIVNSIKDGAVISVTIGE